MQDDSRLEDLAVTSVFFIWPSIIAMTLVIGMIVSIAITSKKNLEENPVRWATNWVLAWTPFAVALFVLLLDIV